MTKLSVIASRALVGLAFLSVGVNAATISDKTNFDKNFESGKKDGNYTTKKDAELLKADSEINYDFTKDSLGVKDIKIEGSKDHTITIKKDANFGGAKLINIDKIDTSSAYGFEISSKSTIIGDGANQTLLLVGKNSKITGLSNTDSALLLKSQAGLIVYDSKLDVNGKTTLESNSGVLVNNGQLNLKDLELTNKAEIAIHKNGKMNANDITLTNGGEFELNSGFLTTTGNFTAKDLELISKYSNISIGKNFTLNSGANSITLANNTIKVKGDADIKNTKFSLEGTKNLVGKFDLVQVGGKFTSNPIEQGSNNSIDKISYSTDIKDLLTNKNLLEAGKYELNIFTKGSAGADVDGSALTTALGLDYTLALSKDGKILYVNGEAKGLDKKEMLELLKSKAITEKTLVDAAKTTIDNAKTEADKDKGDKNTAYMQAQNITKDKEVAFNTAQDTYNKNKTEENKKALEVAQTALNEAKKAESSAKAELNTATNLANNLANASKDLEKRSTALTNVANETNINKLLGAIMAGGNSRVANHSINSLKNKNQTLTAGLLLDSNNLASMSNAISNSGNINESYGILDSIASTKHDAGKILSVITNNNFFKSTRDNAKNVASSSNGSSSAISAVNISNDMAISGRFAKFNNPYSKTYFASLATDAKYDYYESYNNSVWANVFGGANIIDGNSGGVYGISIGADKNINESVLLGAYFTYADASLKDNNLKQDSDNFQLGLYSLIKLPNDFETNFKIFGQIGKTNQDIHTYLGTNSSDFNRRFFGISANVGKVFSFNEGLFVKPFVGANYYYTKTPSYSEKGTILAQNVHKNTNNSASLELGVELRKYLNSSSYFYATPKLEQYIINNGNDYVGSFVGSNATFKIAGDDKKKTYGQLLIGGNMDLNNDLSLNIGVGAKQILAGKIDSKNETYLSGNIGLKYRF